MSILRPDPLPILLNLSGYRILRVENDEEIRLWVESERSEVLCPTCGQRVTTLYDHRPARRIRHETLQGKALYLVLRPKRFRCAGCGTLIPEELPEVPPYHRQTTSFADRIRNRVLCHSATEVAEEECLLYSTVRARLAEAIEDFSESDIHRIGIDEFAQRKGREYHLIIMDLDTHRTIAVLEDRSKETLEAWLREQQTKTTIDVVVIDMWRPYAVAVREVCPNAQLVIDPFHVVRHVQDALSIVRRDIQKKLSEEEREELQQARHWIHANREKLSPGDKMKLDELLRKHPMLRKAYWLKEHFRTWYRLGGTRARQGLSLWYRLVTLAGLAAFQEVRAMIERWKPHILAFFGTRLSNGVTEGINNKVKLIKRKCYGRLSFVNLRARILFQCRGRTG